MITRCESQHALIAVVCNGDSLPLRVAWHSVPLDKLIAVAQEALGVPEPRPATHGGGELQGQRGWEREWEWERGEGERGERESEKERKRGKDRVKREMGEKRKEKEREKSIDCNRRGTDMSRTSGRLRLPRVRTDALATPTPHQCI